VSKGKLSSRGARIVKALNQLADDLAAGTRLETKYTVRQVRVIPKPSLYPPTRVRAVRELLGASQEVFAQLLAVSPMTVRSWEQGSRQPSPIARRFLDEIEMAPGHFRGRILDAAASRGRSIRAKPSAKEKKTISARNQANHEWRLRIAVGRSLPRARPHIARSRNNSRPCRCPPPSASGWPAPPARNLDRR
jgi:putative transcriptional regulator